MPTPSGSPLDTPMTRVAGPMARPSEPGPTTATSRRSQPPRARADSTRRSPSGAWRARRPSGRDGAGASSTFISSDGVREVWLALTMPSKRMR